MRKHCALDNETPLKLVCLTRGSFGIAIARDAFSRRHSAVAKKHPRQSRALA